MSERGARARIVRASFLNDDRQYPLDGPPWAVLHDRGTDRLSERRCSNHDARFDSVDRVRGAARPAADLVPKSLRFAVRDAVGGWGLTVGRIEDLFRMEGFEPAAAFEPTASGARRAAAEQFDTVIDFSSPSQVERYLKVVARVLDDLDNDDLRAKHEVLTRELARADIERDDRGRLRLRRPPLVMSMSVPVESDIRLQLDRLERLDQEPEEMIGAAKDLVEAVAKHVLDALHEPIPTGDDVVALSKAALAKLKLTPDAIAPTAKGADTMVRVLGSLGQVAGGVEALRHLYGTGHGRARRTAGLQRRHAELAARSAGAYAAFVLDTLYDEAAPWHPRKEPDRAREP